MADRYDYGRDDRDQDRGYGREGGGYSDRYPGRGGGGVGMTNQSGYGGDRSYGGDYYDMDQDRRSGRGRNIGRYGGEGSGRSRYDRGYETGSEIGDGYMGGDYRGGYGGSDYEGSYGDRGDRASYGREFGPEYGYGGGYGGERQRSGQQRQRWGGGGFGPGGRSADYDDRNQSYSGRDSGMGYASGGSRYESAGFGAREGAESYGRNQAWSGYEGGGYGGGSSYGDRNMRVQGGYIEGGRGEGVQNVGEHHGGKGPKDYSRSADRIREDVCDRLTDDYRLDASSITVRCAGGEVTLDGTINSRSDKRRAEDIAESVSGVRHVQNNLRVSESDQGSSYGSTTTGGDTTLGTRSAGTAGDGSTGSSRKRG